MTQDRRKSWAMWAGIAGAIWVILSAFGIPARAGITNETFQIVLNALGTILTLLGVVNNPTSKDTL